MAPHLDGTAHIIPYHFVLEGRLRVRTEDGGRLELGPGESVLFPRNDAHMLGGDLDLPPVKSDDVVERSADGGLSTIVLGHDGPETEIICGFLGTQDVHGNPILNALPPTLRLDVRQGSAAEWAQSTFRYAAEQITAGRMGSEAMLGKLSEMLLVEAIQRYADALPDSQVGWLAGLRDGYVSRALALLHGKIAEPWTVDDLARQVGLSRSVLADRFGDVLGLPPMQYLANWRIHVAAHELIGSNKSILQIAQEVGYDSEASFTRAFKRIMKLPPATWRHERRQ